VRSLLAAVATIGCSTFAAHSAPKQGRVKTMLMEVVRNSWNGERNETLVYLRVYSDGFAEAHPMRKVDFRAIHFDTKQLSPNQLQTLQHILFEPATAQLQPRYVRYWGNKDFGYKYTVTIHGKSEEQHMELVNFQPFLAGAKGKPYPAQLEKLGCEIWRLRAEVTGEPLEKDWLKGCAELGY
jgi:hypothetical protein